MSACAGTSRSASLSNLASLQTACAGAPSLADMLADCAWPMAQSHLRFSMVENRSRRSPASICVQASVGAESQGRQTACAGAPSLADTLAACVRPPAQSHLRFIDGRKSVSSSAHANMRATTDGAEIPRSGNSLPRRAIVLGYSPRPAALAKSAGGSRCQWGDWGRRPRTTRGPTRAALPHARHTRVSLAVAAHT